MSRSKDIILLQVSPKELNDKKKEELLKKVRSFLKEYKGELYIQSWKNEYIYKIYKVNSGKCIYKYTIQDPSIELTFRIYGTRII